MLYIVNNYIRVTKLMLMNPFVVRDRKMICIADLLINERG